MKRITFVLYCFLTVLMINGCASTTVTSRQSHFENETPARPNRIIVYDFAATPEDVSAYSVVAGRYERNDIQLTPEQLEKGRELGAEVAKALVVYIQKMGLPAMRAEDRPGPPQIGDMVINGEFVSITWGSRGMRMTIGFGRGRSELTTVVEGYLVTKYGLRPLKSREIESRGDSLPGLLLPVAVGGPIGLVVGGASQFSGETGTRTISHIAEQTSTEIARELEADFRRAGWI